MGEFLAFMAPPFAACLAIVGVHAYLGLHVLQREVIFVDLALAQMAALGSTLAFFAGYELGSGTAYVCALGATFAGAAIFSLTRMRHSANPQEAIIGIVYAVSAAAGVLVLDRAPHGAEHLKSLLVGAILWVSWADVVRLVSIYAVVGFFHWFFRQRFMALSFSEDEAAAEDRSTRWWDFLFYASFGLVITQSVQIAGVLLVFSFLIVPAVCAALFTRRIGARLALGWIIGFVVSAVGCSLSYVADLPTGATVVCTFGLALLLLGAMRIILKLT